MGLTAELGVRDPDEVEHQPRASSGLNEYVEPRRCVRFCERFAFEWFRQWPWQRFEEALERKGSERCQGALVFVVKSVWKLCFWRP